MRKALSLPDFPLTGSCQCGAVRYSLAAAPLVLYFCHCTECQKQSSSAFGQSMRVNTKDLTISGKLSVFSRPGDTGNELICEFCPTCGTRLFHRRASYTDALNIKAGTLDDASWIKPAGHIWTKSKQGWFQVPVGCLNYEGQPETYGPLMERWQQMLAVST